MDARKHIIKTKKSYKRKITIEIKLNQTRNKHIQTHTNKIQIKKWHVNEKTHV